MQPEELLQRLRQRPFEPFAVRLADGRAFPVPHPDFLSIAPRGTDLALWAEDGGIGGYLDAALIAEVRTEEPKRGSSKRRSSKRD